ncbi:ATP-dependent DNA helicase RecG [Luteolibacter pohnpeiensis]|uniref:ATP-dependent DNA helicase RecG n=1 Tax=Luteolibacter pohnpeiensis TaxID=454153 RepID=A0A934S8F0_9BACT|nr:ATP-dependent DNA helicase RecG [Luteolibacter pohnpeiensis]MBK1881592.1 ATP-dependent DNA helicase RecG [Luteolibacter pohnpeiensis]
MISASDHLATLDFILPKEALALADSGFKQVSNLLFHIPKRYEDRRSFDAFPNQATAKPVCLRGKVVDSSLRRFGAGKRFYEAVVMNDLGGVFGSGKVTCRWFNMPFIQKLVAVGHDVILYGKIKESGGRLIVEHPEFEIIREDEDEDSIHLERIVPIYRNVSGISQRRLREVIYGCIRRVSLDELDQGAELGVGLQRSRAVQRVHFPENEALATEARRRLALEEFVELQLKVLWRKRHHSQVQGRVMGRKTTLLKQFHANLPFDLTAAQKRSIKEIAADMREPRPMNRLLQGDVGAGKTFVAMAAMLLAIESGCQAALMAPTQILAEQHYLTFKKWLEPLGVRISLNTSSRSEQTFMPLEGKAQILIGTHALFFGDAGMDDLGFVVIDEQHKFGVAQRSALINRGVAPDVLVMSATPIPRTLTMTVYGDLDVSLLDEKPAGRGKVITAMRVKPKQTDVTQFLKDQLHAGRQAYLVYPLVEESESLKVESAVEALGKWTKRLSGFEVGLIHGKLSPEEKESTMTRFRDGLIHVLVSTTVIEVGVDVPNATVMMIHHADRFGLAQIHQLRGRIGRGGHKGYCILLTDGKNPEGLEKLKILESTADGFAIAEADLKLRGPGDVLGTEQSGLSDLRFADFLGDTHLLLEARSIAARMLDEDPTLEGRHRDLQKLVIDGGEPGSVAI